MHELVQKAAADPAGQSDVKDLEEALEYADQEIGAREGNALNIWDTKVRILLKLGRVDEAFTIVQRVLKKDSSVTDFQDIKTSTPYKALAHMAELLPQRTQRAQRNPRVEAWSRPPLHSRSKHSWNSWIPRRTFRINWFGVQERVRESALPTSIRYDRNTSAKIHDQNSWSILRFCDKAKTMCQFRLSVTLPLKSRG